MVLSDNETYLSAKYLYNSSDEIIGFKWVNDTADQSTYYYLKNLQGDITGVVSATGKMQVSYSYDVFGKMSTQYHYNTSSLTWFEEMYNQIHISALNPFGYRGYCYDGYTELYYLQSRYYDPNTGRFINADDTNYLNATGTVLGCNLFAYCENDPVNRVDPRGNVSISAIVGAIIGFGVGAILLPLFADYKGYTGTKKSWFIGLGTAALSIIGGVLGHYTGKAFLAIYSKGKTFASILNKGIAKAIAKFTKTTFSVASGNGYKITFGKYVVRIMTGSLKGTNYLRISHITKGSMLLSGVFSSNQAITHIPITIGNLIKLIDLILKLKK